MEFLKNELTGFNNFNVIYIKDYLYTSYDKVDGIKLKKDQVTMMTVYTPKLPIAILTNKLEESQNFLQYGKQYITDVMMISKGIPLLNNTGAFTNDIKERNRKPNNSKTGSKFKTHFFQAHKELKAQATMTANGGYSAVVNNVYGGITHHLSPAYHTKTAEALADMET